MHLIIDGYNLLGARGHVGRADRAAAEEARERLLRELAGYRQRKGHPITVVFDAWQQPGAARHEHRAGVEVIYTAHGERADQVIQRLAEQFGQDCAVVSSDREVASFVKAHGGFVIGALEFESKLRPGEPRELETPRSPVKKGNPKKLPKAVRKRNRQLRAF
jgi:predicted RNA-binding protein with PIN domain